MFQENYDRSSSNVRQAVQRQQPRRFDGTAAGTVLVKDIFAGGSTANPRFLTNVNGTLYFSANDGVNGYELWKSDGTAAGTVPDTGNFVGTGADDTFVVSISVTDVNVSRNSVLLATLPVGTPINIDGLGGHDSVIIEDATGLGSTLAVPWQWLRRRLRWARRWSP